MINRLPKEFRVPTTNGIKHSPVSGDAADGLTHRLTASIARCIGSYPVAALSAAFVVGLCFGRVIKR